MASKSERRDHVSRVLDLHVNSIQENFQMLEKPAASSLDKVEWSEVTKLGAEISKQATVAGMLWSGEAPDVKALEENIGAYSNLLHGFILLCHGSTAGAGTTLHANIQASAKQVVNCSISLLREAVSSYGSCKSNKRLTIPQLSGSVWEACDALKKIPTTNCTAVGRAITQVAVSVKDVIREMEELKCASSADGGEGTSGDACLADEEGDCSEFDFGDDLSPEEMSNAQLAINVMSSTLIVIKELIRFITTLLRSSSDENTERYTASLERLLSYCQDIGNQVSDLGASIYPPQEIPLMKSIAKEMHCKINEICEEIKILEGSSDGVFGALKELENSLGKLDQGLSSDLTAEMEKLDM